MADMIGQSVSQKSGFTLIELILVIGILSVLFAIMSLRFFGVQGRSAVNEAADILVADLKSQQTKAMAGAAVSGGTVAGYGIHLENTTYTLFAGDTYTPALATNTVVELPTGVTVTTAFANSTIVLLRASGEVNDYVAGQDYIDLTSAVSSDTRRIEINQLGVVTGGI